MAGLGRTIPALPVREIGRAVGHLRDRLRFEPVSFIGTASCRIETDDVDGLPGELAAADVLQPVSCDGVTETDFRTREFATLDADGDPVEFFRWQR